MAFFSTQKEYKTKRSHSTERIKPNLTASIASIPLPPILIRSTSRPTTIYDAHLTDVHVQGSDPNPPTPKSNTTVSRHSLRRIPVPSLSPQDLDKISYGRPRTSPIFASSSSTSASRKSSIADTVSAANATISQTNPDHLKSPADIQIPTPPRSSPSNWESSSGSSRNPVGAYDLKNSPSPMFDSSIPVSSRRPASQKPQRAVLRRKSSAKQPLKSQPSTPSLGHRKSKPDLGISSVTATPQRTISSGRQSVYVVSAPMSLDAAHCVRRSTSGERKLRSYGNPSPPLSPQTLTPAGAVAAAYKEQEKRKKDMKEFVSANADGLSREDSYDESGGVYYTVFGSSGKVVAVGAPEDESWLHHDLSNYTPNKPKTVSRTPSLGALGKLSRKPSTKFKKSGTGNASGNTPESECGHEGITGDDEFGRLSFQGRRSTSLPSNQRSKRPPGISTENSEVGMEWDSPQSASTFSKSAGWSVDDPSPSTGGKIWKLMKRISTGGLREKYNVQEAAPPVPALPKGLLPAQTKPKPKTRSAPHSPDDSRPPVSRYIRGRSSFGDAPFSNRHRNTQGVPSSASLNRPPTLSSGKNPSHRRRSTNTRSSSPVSSDKASSKYWQKSRSSSVSTFEEMPPLPGRVLTNGPILSPVELYKLEKEQATAELSSPPSTVDSHSPTPSPSNHHRNTLIVIRRPSLRDAHMRSSGDDSETDGMSPSDFVALPSPPRHHYRSNPHVVYHQSNDSGTTVGSVSTSPMIPMFTTHDVVNQFHSARGSGVGMSRSLNSSSASQSTGISSNEFGVTPAQPPPRPQRSDRRKTLVMNPKITTRVSQDREWNSQDRHHGWGIPRSTSVPYPKERMSGSSPEFEGDGDGRSCGTFGCSQSKGLVQLVKTSQDSESSRENLRPSSSIHSGSPLKFRELGSGEGGKDRKVLTEKEKADRWDDLLERSDRAGGTIHIGNTRLLSDSLRFSDYSTLTASAL